MAMEYITIQMEMFIKEIGWIICVMDMVDIIIKMEHIMDNGKMI